MSKVITIKLFTPIPFMRTPEALLPEKVKRSYALDQTWVLSKGLVHAMEDAEGVEVPLGKWVDAQGQRSDIEKGSSIDYELEVPMDLSEIADFCKKHYPKVDLCVQGAMMLHTLPLKADEITLEPLPEKLDPQDIVLDTSEIVDPEVIDVEFERDFVVGHSLKGYPVNAPVFGPAKIDKQIQSGPFTYYRVMANKPMPFEKFAKALNISSTSMTLEDWWKLVPGEGAGSATFPAMDPELREKLEAGERVSRVDVLFKELFDRGCIDMDNRVICQTFPSDSITIRSPKRDMAVQIKEHSGTGGLPGRIISA